MDKLKLSLSNNGKAKHKFFVKNSTKIEINDFLSMLVTGKTSFIDGLQDEKIHLARPKP